MLRSLYTAATGMDAQQLSMDVIANNLANASTTGYKAQRPEFEDLLSDTVRGAGTPDARGGANPAPMQIGLGVRAGSTTRTFAQGTLTVTSNPTDLAINGTGFFRVELASGDVAYTRAGNFTLDSNGRLVTQHGEVVDPGITVPASTTSLTVGADGTVSAVEQGKTEPVQLGQLNLYTFTNPGGLSDIGNNEFQPTSGSGEAQEGKAGENGVGTIAQGQLEGSNVQAVTEMVNMISAQRAYELNSKVIQSADQMLQKLTSLR
jgi:flagellar basal-body rod protein FlgG